VASIAILGSGKRWKAFAAPGNPGIAEHAQLVTLDVTDHGAVLAFCDEDQIGFVVVGPEAPLVDGWAMLLRGGRAGVSGPNKLPAQLEGSKGFTKDLCARANIPTAGYQRVTSRNRRWPCCATRRAGRGQGRRPGRRQGRDRGDDHGRGEEAVRDIFAGRFGDEAVIEEFMEGEEASFLRADRWRDHRAFCLAQDHKRVGDGDRPQHRRHGRLFPPRC
jgi:phosphoribosylamine--glycine ligase